MGIMMRDPFIIPVQDDISNSIHLVPEVSLYTLGAQIIQAQPQSIMVEGGCM